MSESRGTPPVVPPERALHALSDAHAEAVWESLARWREEGRRFVLLTVIESRGFTPRKPGTHMLLDEAGRTVGTIGGGAIEHHALAEAAALLVSEDTVRTVRKQLTTELGMCCGGEMVVHLEVLSAMPRLALFGGGYLARPIAALAAACGFAVTVMDGRDEWLTRERFPAAARHVGDSERAARAWQPRATDFIVVVTHDHALDQRLVNALIEQPVQFVGMIGSQAKQRKFAQRLAARGLPPERIARLRTPLGLAIGAQTPEEIAVSVVAELIAVRRGADPAAGWGKAPRSHGEPARDRSGGPAAQGGHS